MNNTVSNRVCVGNGSTESKTSLEGLLLTDVHHFHVVHSELARSELATGFYGVGDGDVATPVYVGRRGVTFNHNTSA